jgi:hypothetical protein
MIKNFYGDRFITASKTETYGGVDLSVSMSPMYTELLEWLVKFKQEHELEKRLREESPAVRNAWEQYQVVKTLATKEKANV